MRREPFLKVMCILALAALSVSYLASASEAEEQAKPDLFDWIEEDPPLSDEELLKRFALDDKNSMGVTTPVLKEDYKLAKERAAKGDSAAEFKAFQDAFAKALAKRMGERDTTKTERREVALLLHYDGYTELARPLIERVREQLARNERYTAVEFKSVDEAGHSVVRMQETATDAYREICGILGLTEYTWPEEEFSDYYRWEIAEWSVWEKKRQELLSAAGDMFFTKAQIDEIKKLENELTKAGRFFRNQDKLDGYAIIAREAFIRFKQKNSDTNKRSTFSPKALGREGEKFDDVWCYTYWKPFVVFLEKSPSSDSEKVKRGFAPKTNLLRQEEQWFRKNFIEPFALKRVLPIEGPLMSRALGGKKFETPGELAEAEGWPLEIIVLKDGQTFQKFIDEQTGGVIPGARAYYSNPLKQLTTWDDPNVNDGDDQVWFNECVLAYETFHMLADHYAAKPIEWEWKYGERGENGLRKKVWSSKGQQPRFLNLLVSEGLADCVAGFKKEGEGSDASYTFMEQNRARIPQWQQTYEQFGKQNLFRIQDLLTCVHYGHIGPVGNACWKRIGMLKKMGGYPRDPSQAYLGIYFAAACQASAFFYQFEENGSPKYRDKWLAYLKVDFTGSVERSYEPEAGIKAFKEAFGIATDDDFDKLEAELVAWAVALKSDD